MSLHTCNRSLWTMINYYQLSFPFPKRCALMECREDFGDDFCGGGFASGITTSSQAGCEGWWHPDPYWGQFSQELLFLGEKNPGLMRGGRGGKKPPRLSKKPGSSLVWRVTHPIEWPRCWRKYWDGSELCWLPRGSLEPFKI